MASTFNYTDEVLDFDDANNFLSMLSTTVPSVEKPQKWDFDLAQSSEIPDSLFVSDLDSVSSGLINSGSSFTADLMDAPRAEFLPQAVDYQEAGERMMSFSSVSGSDSAGSHFAGSANGTPNTSVSSPHATPENHAKKEPTSPFSPSMYSRNITIGSDFGSDSADVLSPRSKVSPKDKVNKPAKKTKVSHNMIEKKYRTNINSKIMELRDAVPTLRIAVGKDNVRVTDLDGLAPASKLNKASVLTKATEYIKHLERKNDLMAQQLSQLQTLVRDTSVNSSSQLIHRREQQQMPLAPDANLEFGFTSGSSFDAANYAAYTEPQLQPNVSNPPANELQMNSNLLLGGMATVLGGSLISGENFKGMASVPFFPSFLSNPSASTLQILPVVRAAVVFSGALMMAKPVSSFFGKKDKKSQSQNNVWISWLLSSLCLQSPKPAAVTNELVVARLLGQYKFSYYGLLRDYASLSSCELTFETCFLQVLLGVILIRKFPILSKVIKGNIKWKASLLTNLNYSGDDQNLLALSKLIKDVDGLSLFESETMITRLVNLSCRKPINSGVTNGDNISNYVDVLLKSKTSIYSIIFNWRILEIIYEINLSYLECFISDSDKKEKCIADVQNDISKIDDFLKQGFASPELLEYFTLFKCLVNPGSTPELFTLVKSKITNGVQNINAIYNGQELTDDEKISDDESSLGDEDTSNSTAREEHLREDFSEIKSQRSMIYSTNLMNEEKFIALVSCSFFYYSEKHGKHDPLEQLRFLCFKDSNVPLSLISFTCLLKVLCLAVNESEKEEDDEDFTSSIDAVSSGVLDSLVKMIRTWLNDDNEEHFLSHTLRSELTDIAISKGMALND